MRRRIRLLFLTLLLALCCQVAIGQVKLPQVYQLSWRTSEYNDLPMLAVKLPDGKTYRFYLDTGAGNCVLDRQVGKSLGLPLTNYISKDGEHYESIITSAEFEGKLRIPRIPMILLDMTLFRQATPDLAGIIGLNLLDFFAVRFDFHQQTVDFILNGKVAGTILEPRGAERFPLLLSKNELYFVEGVIDDYKLPLLLDTGAEISFFRSKKDFAALKPLAALKGHVVQSVDHTSKNTFLVSQTLYRFKQLTLGSLVWKEPVLGYSKEDAHEEMACLGIDFFRQYKVLLDFPAKMMYLTLDSHYMQEQFAWVGIGANFFIDKNQIRIAQVYAPSPANAVGLKGNDEIVAVDGQTVEQRSPQKTLEYLKSLKKEGQEVVLRVRNDRDRKEREVRLKVVKLL
jgi:hypothetical protein